MMLFCRLRNASLFCCLFLISIFCSSLTAEENIIKVPLTFHIINDLKIPKGSVPLKSWLSEEDLKVHVLPEINRIWKPANIEFVLDQVKQSSALNPSNKQQITGYIANAVRDESGNSDPQRIELLSQLIDFSHENPHTLNIYFVPYLGEASQGHAKRKLKRAFIGQWSDKESKGKYLPERFQLIEKGTFRSGSMARTVAHEIGHLLGLAHPDKQNQKEFNQLMGGKKPGYTLGKEDIKRARKHAQKLFTAV